MLLCLHCMHLTALRRPTLHPATRIPMPAGLLSAFLEVLLAIVPKEQLQLEESGEQQQQGNGQAQGGGGKLDRQALLYCERFVEFLTDLLSQASSWLSIAAAAARSLLPRWPGGSHCAKGGAVA